MRINIIEVMNLLALNEISGNTRVAYRFSNAGTGNSGYSFGRSQFDVTNNKYARQFLKLECDFTDRDIKRLLAMDPQIDDLNAKLYKHRHQIDNYDKFHVSQMIDHVLKLQRLPQMDEEAFTHLVDYHNQFNLSIGGKMHRFLQSKKQIDSYDILNFKLNELKWGREQPGDVRRRWNNIHNNINKVM